MPEPYRILLACRRHGALWWSGGISSQPYVMMLEFGACRLAEGYFDEQLENYKNILQGK
jgi:hypothetical protein